MKNDDDSMAFIECGNCIVIVPLIDQYPVQGIMTFIYHCTRCHGKVHLQRMKNPHTGETLAKQVRLTGTAEEFRPEAIRPGSKLQIPVAYTLGSSKSAQHVQAPPLTPPPPAYRLGAPGQLPPDHPMHPGQIRSRVQPIRYWG